MWDTLRRPGLTAGARSRTLGEPSRRILCCARRQVRLPVPAGTRDNRTRAARTWRCPGDSPTFWSNAVSKRTFQPNNRRRAKVHGFRLRMRTRAGRAILSARRRKGRAQISA
ncbi:hypothetical protein GCM10009790_22730 [Georgenia ruanii]